MTKRRWKVAKRRSILPRACGVGGFHAQGLAILEPEHAQLIKARLTHAESMAGLAGVEDIGPEVGQGLADEIGGKSVDDLALFIVPLCGAKGTSTRAAA
jgi:hypothetical protein